MKIFIPPKYDDENIKKLLYFDRMETQTQGYSTEAAQYNH
jgi:hypothetical protein